MALPVEALTPTSTSDDIKRAIARSVEQCMSEGKPRETCVALVYRQAETATGKSTADLSKQGMEYGESGSV